MVYIINKIAPTNQATGHTCPRGGHSWGYCPVALLFESNHCNSFHDDVIKWKHFPRYWPFVRGIHRSPVHSPHKGQWRRALIFSFICAWMNSWINNREAVDLRRHRAHYHYDVVVMRRSVTRRFHLSAPDVQMSCRNLTPWEGTRMIAPAISTTVT